jgi:hypothetical protein
VVVVRLSFEEFVVFVAFLLFIVFLWIMFLMLELAVLSIQSTLLNQTSKIYNDYVDAARVANEEFEVLKADPTTPTEFVMAKYLEAKSLWDKSGGAWTVEENVIFEIENPAVVWFKSLKNRVQKV